MPWVSKQQLEVFQQTAAALQAELERVKKLPYLVSVERHGRVNKFLFCRDGELIEVETMGMLADNMPMWKEKLLR